MPALAEPSKQPSGRWRDLGVRAASAAILLPAALLCLWVGGGVWTVLVLLAGLLMMREWRAMAGNWPYAVSLPVGLLWILPAVLGLEWLRAREPGGMGNVLFLLCVVWASDIGAYMVGRLVGGPKLAPAISPGKTRSGAVGGLLAAIGVGAAAAALGGGVFSTAMLTAAVLGVISQAGDLLESAAKRHFGVKDSGNLIPGHGGLLDRLDAVLTVAPAAAAIVMWRGEVLWR